MAEIGLVLIVAMTLSGCNSAGQADSIGSDGDPSAAIAEIQPTLKCGANGELQTEIYGAIAAQLDWDHFELECTGMPRPDGRGARLHFAGNVGSSDQRVAIIIAIPDLDRQAVGNEYPSNVTVIEEGNSRFFSTPNLENCLTDITALDALDDAGNRYTLVGLLYCVSPLPEVNGSSSISIPELRFQGLLDWGST
jgi:hypothetical protein